ncbi:MAG TPA: hypothetical protein VEI97_13205 [bacterium]|nr:hypothetical protein [bacterium]
MLEAHMSLRAFPLVAALLLTLSGLALGCSEGEFFGIRGTWTGQANFEEAGTTHNVLWDISNPPGRDYPSNHQEFRFFMNGENGCQVSIDFGARVVDGDSTITFPVRQVQPGPCFPAIPEAELQDGGRLEMAITGRFNEETEQATGTMVVRTVRDGDILNTYLDGEWSATRTNDPN